MAEKTPPEITIRMEQRPEGCLLHVKGELGLPPTTDNFERDLTRLIAGRPKLVVLDLAELSFISSLGIGVLVAARRGVARWGGHFRLAAIEPMILGVFHRAKVDHLFDIFPTVEEAFAGSVK